MPALVMQAMLLRTFSEFESMHIPTGATAVKPSSAADAQALLAKPGSRVAQPKATSRSQLDNSR